MSILPIKGNSGKPITTPGLYRDSWLGTRIRRRFHQGTLSTQVNGHKPLGLNIANFAPVGTLPITEFSALRKLFDIAETHPQQAVFIDIDRDNRLFGEDGKDITPSRVHTAEEVASRVRKLAKGYQDLGIGKGTRVGLMVQPHEIELFESFLALQGLGAIPVLIQYKLPPIAKYGIAKSDPEYLIIGRDSRFDIGASKLALAAQFRKIIKVGKTEISNEKGTSRLRHQITRALNPIPLFFLNYESLLKKGEISKSDLYLDPEPDAPASIKFSSGSEGYPSLITYDYQMIADGVRRTSSSYTIGPGDVELFPVAFYHLSGLIVFWGALEYGIPLVLVETPRAEKKPATVGWALDKMVEHNVSIFPGNPDIIEPVLELAQKRNELLPSLRLIFSGGSPLTSGLIGSVEDLNNNPGRTARNIRLSNFYALTQVGSVSSEFVSKSSHDFNCIGRPFDSVQIKIVDSDGNEVSQGNPGELLVKVNQFPPDLPDSDFTADGFYKTGDIVKINEDGKIVYVDRSKEAINIEGNEIPPSEINKKLKECLVIYGLKEVYAFGVSQLEEDGHAVNQMVAAVYVVKKDSGLDAEKIEKIIAKANFEGLNSCKPTAHFVFEEFIPDDFFGSTMKLTGDKFREKLSDKARVMHKKITAKRKQKA